MEKQLQKNWVETDLEHLFNLVYGKGLSVGELLDEGFDVYGANGIIGKYDKFTYEKSKVIISCRGAASGVIHKTKPQSFITSNSIVLDEVSDELLNLDFVKYAMTIADKSDVITGTAQPQITIQLLKYLQFPLPPLTEQNRIVAKLDALFAQLETIKTSMAKVPLLLKDFRQQVLTQAVTGKLTEEWRKGKELESGLSTILQNRNKYYESLVKENKKYGLKVPKKLDYSEYEEFELSDSYKLPEYWKKSNLKNIADLITDGEHATPKRTEDGYYLLSARNVQNGFISLNNVDYVPKEEYDRIKKRCNPEHKDILISCSGTVGRVSIVPENLEFVMVRSAALVKFQSNTEISKFIEYTLRSDFGQSQILKLQKSTAQANLFLAPIGKIVVPIPSIIEQQEIVYRVESLFAKADAIEKQYETLKAKIDSLPQAILHKAFKGELTQQLDSDGDARELLQQIQELKVTASKTVKSKTNKTATKNVKSYSEQD
ncbi:restriction endonuclease subunit S [Flavobacterium cyclinae]|uniref:restriction endonuclease subunit S n=1 Tax=Flavobacterium cyclinae TaxID=2895947 RepID=UPI001E39195A|nr:restriction endonuclease subunit S [Flavobacterium cyclinae]UGS19864.1 restriction endonuclease subunit S [Flavobacterium cyclinae]